MADWTYIPHKSAYWQPNKKAKELPELKPAHNHKLEHHAERWVCACGYQLGDGRERLLAPCPLARKTSHQNDERFSRTFLQGELLPPLEEQPTTKRSKRKTTNK
jgi:hypothetical protein